jgi:hypothetical protein
MPASSGSGTGDIPAVDSRFSKWLPPTHIQKVGTRLELEVQAKEEGLDDKKVRCRKFHRKHFGSGRQWRCFQVGRAQTTPVCRHSQDVHV